jgi:tRNA G18 (ribose-2'-O)-methylase SpoU
MIRKLSHQEIQQSKPSTEEVKSFARMPLFTVLDDIRSLYNVGAIFRTSDAVLAEKIYLCGITGRPPRKEIDKTALGACEVVPWEYMSSAPETVLKLKEKGVKICALELTDSPQIYNQVVYPFPLAIVLGNEVEGINDNVMTHVDMSVSIPMLGRANSLNVATAYGIIAYEILSQFNNGKNHT